MKPLKNKREIEGAFRAIMETKPKNKLHRDSVPKPDDKNTIHTKYKIYKN